VLAECQRLGVGLRHADQITVGLADDILKRLGVALYMLRGAAGENPLQLVDLGHHEQPIEFAQVGFVFDLAILEDG